jgi:hypothetical protein
MKTAACSTCGSAPFKMNRTSWLCLKHWKLSAMRWRASVRRKSVPTVQQLEALIPDGMICGSCKRVMTWFKKEDSKSVITLQHNRDGSYALICLSCNSRHQHFPGDDFYKIPMDCKRCPRCREARPHADFPKSHERWMGLGPYCRKCAAVIRAERKASLIPQKEGKV